jgi:hypothetical protein
VPDQPRALLKTEEISGKQMSFGFFYTLSCPPVNHQGNVDFVGVRKR